MAKFVLAGRADCPYYAKAELLADYLGNNLPNFRIHKIVQHPDNWEKWLQEICNENGWKHKRSPIIWRELLDRGGRGLLLGGFNDFLEHAQQYYNITSDMMTEEMLLIANENLQTCTEIEAEEKELKSLINPLHIWLNRACSSACYHLIPLLTNGEIFGMETEISLHLNIITLAMLLESEAKAMVARKMQMHPAGIKNLIVWGNISGNSFVDLSKTELYRYDSAIWGPPSFFRPLLDVLFDREWMEIEFVASLSSLSSWRARGLGMAPAHTVATVLRYWYQGSPPGEMISLGVISEGQFGLPEGIVYSMPIRFENGSWEIYTEIEINEKTQSYLLILACDLIREKQVALGEVAELNPQRRDVHAIYRDVEEEEDFEVNEECKASLIDQERALESEDQTVAEETEDTDELNESKNIEEENIEAEDD
ncbi:putative malate dehydrogenase 1B [Crotalus adamanteus]|uniref:Putative malate dehydrogenase 1B n=1 Tax=Crotalus adamanteus TaxID=8729 RepID=A0AAW1C8Z0_CROAD